MNWYHTILHNRMIPSRYQVSCDFYHVSCDILTRYHVKPIRYQTYNHVSRDTHEVSCDNRHVLDDFYHVSHDTRETISIMYRVIFARYRMIPASARPDYGVVPREEVASAVRKLMVGEMGAAARKKAGELRAAAEMASAPGGPQHQALAGMVGKWKVRG
uniref:Uncharacterized protein n=1 Tax=Oryza barthii TaxID=65489 RepID=A0A0D3ERC0_9ORYZ